MERILSCRDVVRCLAIEDTLQQSGMPILYAMARAVVEQRGGTVLVVLTEGSGAPWTSMG